MAAAINAIPNFSNFTGITPIGRVLGQRGDFAMALDTSISTTSFLWVNMTPVGQNPSNQSWNQVVVL